MNKKPVSYLQTDNRWKDKPYRVTGESSTIGSAGCGPTAAAMLIETLTGKTFTPEDACNWSMKHGYKALNNGTYYAYFAPQFEAFGIKCWQLSWTNVYHNPKSSIHDQMLDYLKQGYYVITLMKKGNWTSGGHFIVVWWADNKIRINDPASTKDSRLNGDIQTFRNEAAYYWIVDARAYNGTLPKVEKPKEEEEMTQAEFEKMYAVATEKDFTKRWNTAMQQYRESLRDNDASAWSKEARQYVMEKGIFQGSGTTPEGEPNFMWEDLLTREQYAQTTMRLQNVFVPVELFKAMTDQIQRLQTELAVLRQQVIQ